ncbi:MAG: hypothetical protein JNL60_02125 [Bacteroidia bacterium]|nr:hypothetical protein [Bacteroidia bacterium]
MLTFFRSNKHYLWLVLFLFTISPFVVALFDQRPKDTCGNEKFDPSLGYLKSTDQILAYADKEYKGGSLLSLEDTVSYVAHITDIYKRRFCHGELNYRFSENWIAWVAGKLFWSHFSSMVLTKDVVKYSKCLCNQQTLAYMEALIQKGIDVRTVGLGYKVPGHFLCEVWYGGAWHLYDISIEPNWDRIEHPHRDLEYYLKDKDMFYKIYEGRIQRSLFDKIMEQQVYGERNNLPGKKMKFFQAFTEVLTYIMPIGFLVLFLGSYRKRKIQRVFEI